MISAALSSKFCAALLAVFLLSGRSVSSQKVVTSVSGKRVPVDLIQDHFEKKLSEADLSKNLIYELTDQNLLRGPDLQIDLQSGVRHVTSSSRPLTVILNGDERETPLMKLKTLKAKSYNIIVDDESGHILSVVGNGIVLAPLHGNDFPGMFVNKKAFSKSGIDLSSDVRIFDREQDFSNPPKHYDIPAREKHTVSRALRPMLEAGTALSTRQVQGTCASGTTHYLEIAVAYDNTFCGLFNNMESVATQTVQNIVDDSNAAYAINTCIQLALIHVEAHCNDRNDPYRGFGSFLSPEILTEFQSIWIQSRGNVHRDAALLFTGFPEASNIIGRAFVSAACDTQFGYGWIEGPRTVVFAHEAGHILGGSHTATGIMQATVSNFTPLRFAMQSVPEFANFVDNAGGSSCMSTTRPFGIVGTCGSGFTRNAALSCRNRRLRQTRISLSGSFAGRLSIHLVQRNGQFIVRYRVTGRLFIMRYRDLVGTVSLVGADLGSYITLRGNVKRVDSRYDANGASIPTGQSSCCGQNLFVATDVRVCSNSGGRRRCQTVRRSFRSRFGCTNVCRGNGSGVFSPMSVDQACPSCT